jgi:hypothetical protein
MGFPLDDYTPFGYLANPAARATSWQEHHGGALRTALDAVGLGWAYPWDRRPTATVELTLALTAGERRYVEREQWEALGLHAAYHSARRLTLDWTVTDVIGSCAFVLADADTLVAHLTLRNEAPFARRLGCQVLARVGREVGTPAVAATADGWRLALPPDRVPHVGEGAADAEGTAGAPAPTHRLRLLHQAGGQVAPVGPLECSTMVGPAVPSAGAGPSRRGASLAGLAAGHDWTIDLAPGATAHLVVLHSSGPTGAVDWQAAEAAALADDAAFYGGAPLLSGDWPATWRRGWVYDLESTRLCLRPPGGIFTDVWPAWMVQWPRVVVAEGTLDMLRLGYAAPDLAQRAVLTLFRDAPAPNVPCVFEGGEPNMVAKDGAICGTSPAWCLPFYNIEALFRWTLDRAWLARLYPSLAAYLRWWLRHRVDADGWVVYRCTWEAGEDNSPRLDPAGEGDHVITEFTRPVELQAMMALSAAVLGRLAGELGDRAAADEWATVAADYRARTGALWDETTGRFRDWDKRRDAFVQPIGQAAYWDADPVRYSPLSLTPLLDGIASPEQAARLVDELPAYDTPPWCDWPSWTYAVVESAAAAGQHALGARMATRIVERIYRRNDRRSLAGLVRPLPGVAPEYWPTDAPSYTGSDGYGWGATTLSLVLRQVIGFTESAATDGWSCCLTPGLPAVWGRPGRTYWLRGLRYRGRRIDLGYEVGSDGGLTACLRLDTPAGLTVTPPDGAAVSQPPAGEHRLAVQRGRRYHLTLTPPLDQA